ncbi:hypothetical protein ACW2AV_001049 [Cronobacter sakazakii]|uniref:Uncharacterized protein n=1 Tax=Cronobacter sakazakii (strain ATCC BAA-894) TaxID=290339 RepID=A7MHQ8_CROS8|nr:MULTISPECIES: hypothetical protein [Cronobacter]ABU76269.1 hypothetical protein ESA_01000 [Cronobacter sakazakii ATCC BAA-894]EGT4280976.1 hypothetical protein [Cronobacter malonaticus]EGT4288707.1 hypothetical protein [Cronobacter malonaticus]EGT4298852.1 hypothetical protein [Cronobacter malonaticus]EGT4313716.1 hypothetical protein [Cronobacter malonaticus]
MQFDKEKVFKTFNLPREEFSALEAGPNAHAGNRIELFVNGALTQTLNTESAVTADYLMFMGGVVEAMEKDKTSLESEANKSGRTLATGFRGIGSVPLESVGVPEVLDK